MARILITGSADGLGRAAAETLLGDGHEVIVHARSAERLAAVEPLIGRGASAVVGDLADLDETRAVADQVNRLGRVDAVIHNAGVTQRPACPAGQRRRALPAHRAHRPAAAARLPQQRHARRRTSRRRRPRLERTRPTASYSDSKLFVTTLAVAVARLWPDVYSNAVDPGWVPTKMGGPGAPDDLRLGHLTQEWLATSDDPEARTSGGYWYHQQRRTPHPAALDPQFQDELLAALARFTGAPVA